MSMVKMNEYIILYKKGFRPPKKITIFVPTCTGWMKGEKMVSKREEKRKNMKEFSVSSFL